jgi:ABC-type transporter Mla subunit MlaD
LTKVKVWDIINAREEKMDKIVKIQINAHIADVMKISAATMEQTTDHLENLRRIVARVKTHLHTTNVLIQEDRIAIGKILEDIDEARRLLSKIDIRLSDVSEVSAGLISVFEKSDVQSENAK